MARLTIGLLTAVTLAVHSPRVHAQPEFSGFLEYDNITYFETPDKARVNGRNQVILKPKVRHVLSSKADLFGSVELRYDEDDSSRDRVFLDEAYLNIYAGPVDLRVGLQIYAWGRADGFNPTDFSSRDYSDVLDIEDEKLGLVSVHGTYYKGDWALEGILMPSFRSSVLPGVDSRWWPAFPAAIDNPLYGELGPPRLKADYQLKEGKERDEGLQSLQYALRLNGKVRGWDFSISWFDGFNDLPSLRVSTSIDSTFKAATLVLEPRYLRKRAVGIDFATALGSIGLHGEAAYYITSDWSGTKPDVDDPYLHYVIGVDHTIYDLVGDKDLFLLAEWSQEIQIPDRSTVYGFTDLEHLFRESLFGKADLSFTEFSKVTIEGFYNVETDDWWVRPGAAWSVWDGLEFRIGVDLIGGPGDSYLGSVSNNERLQARLKYSF